MAAAKTGSCLCGAVKFEITGPLRPVIACHCLQCRKQTGSYMSATGVKDRYLKLVETRGLKWYRSSEVARRGFLRGVRIDIVLERRRARLYRYCRGRN